MIMEVVVVTRVDCKRGGWLVVLILEVRLHIQLRGRVWVVAVEMRWEGWEGVEGWGVGLEGVV